MTLILGRKRGMTQLHAEDGTLTGVTVISAGPCVVCQVRTQENDGYNAVQLGFETLPDRLVKKPQRGHFKKGGVAPMRFLREERLNAPATASVGDVITTEAFSVGDVVDVIGTTKGHGFAGTIKRHNFSRGPETHGSMNVRAPGSIATRRLDDGRKRIGAVIVVGIDDGEPSTRLRQHISTCPQRLTGTPRSRTSRRGGVVAGQIGEILEHELERDMRGYAPFDRFGERVAGFGADDDCDTLDAGAKRIVDGVFHQGLAGRTDRLELFQPAEPSPHSRGKYD